jgi:hypothetical protein
MQLWATVVCIAERLGKTEGRSGKQDASVSRQGITMGIPIPNARTMAMMISKVCLRESGIQSNAAIPQCFL